MRNYLLPIRLYVSSTCNSTVFPIILKDANELPDYDAIGHAPKCRWHRVSYEAAIWLRSRSEPSSQAKKSEPVPWRPAKNRTSCTVRDHGGRQGKFACMAERRGGQSMTTPFPVGSIMPIISALANMLDWSMSGSQQLGCDAKTTAHTPSDAQRPR